MKKAFSLFLLTFVMGISGIIAQSTTMSVKSDVDCTKRTVEFTVPDGKVAKLMSMDIFTSFTTCDASQPAPTVNFARIYKKTNGNSNTKVTALYKKTIEKSGTVTESNPIQSIKLGAGDYVLEVSKAPNLEAKLIYQLF